MRVLGDLFTKIIENFSKIIREICGIAWLSIGVFSLYATYGLWHNLSLAPKQNEAANVLQIMMFVTTIIGIFYIFFAVIHFRWTKEKNKKIGIYKKLPYTIIHIIAYGLNIVILLFFTTSVFGPNPLIAKYSNIVLIADLILLFLDIILFLELYYDQWEYSPIAKFIRKKIQNRKKG